MAPLRKQARLKVQTRDDSGRLGGYLAEPMDLGSEGGVWVEGWRRDAGSPSVQWL